MPSPTVGVLQLKRNDGAPAYVPPRPVLATTAVKHVGDPVAMVVAETLQQAQDAAGRWKPLTRGKISLWSCMVDVKRVF